MTDIGDLIRRGLQGWTGGDLDTLQDVLDPHVTLRWIEPGPWDCTGRDQVMELLRPRRTEEQRPGPVHIHHVDEHTFIVSTGKPADAGDGSEPAPIAARVSVAGGKVIAMHQYHDDRYTARS